MCRQNQMFGFGALMFGLGLLIGCCVDSGFWCFFLGIGTIVFGFVQFQRK